LDGGIEKVKDAELSVQQPLRAASAAKASVDNRVMAAKSAISIFLERLSEYAKIHSKPHPKIQYHITAIQYFSTPCFMFEFTIARYIKL
jgi:hypothetical protein